MYSKHPSLPTLPLFRLIYANVHSSLAVCQPYKIYKRYYYYIDILYIMYQLFICYNPVFIGILVVFYTDIYIEKCGKLGNLANFALKPNTTKDHESKNSWQTFGKLGKLLTNS